MFDFLKELCLLPNVQFIDFVCFFFFRPKKFTMKGYKRYWFTYKDLRLFLFKSREEATNNAPPSIFINLRGCEVTPEVILAQNKFNIKLEVPPESGNGANTEMWIRCDDVSFTIFSCPSQMFFMCIN